MIPVTDDRPNAVEFIGAVVVALGWLYIGHGIMNHPGDAAIFVLVGVFALYMGVRVKRMGGRLKTHGGRDD